MIARRAAAIPWALLALLASAPVLVAQVAVFRSQVELVRVDVAVTRDGRPVTGLGAEDFDLSDNGVRQTVMQVLLEQVPVDVHLMLDTSSSLRGERLTRLQVAARRLLSGLRSGDRAALWTFSHRVSTRQPLTADLALVSRAVTSMEGEGWTALFDAIFEVCLSAPDPERRAAAVLLTDGMDTMSWLAPDHALASARRSPIIYYVVSEPPGSQSGQVAVVNDRFLKNLAGDTGGRVWPVSATADLAEAFGRIVEDITMRYVIVYEPTGVRGDGWHALDVRLKGGRRGDVTARPGYLRR
jgi:VWFA-related protein